ncbi:putative DENN domain-containing protein 10 [Blattamonas nauphoetae]|uniref:DENN domain-containing protein 10 n=1 Tax=Blattamonas nauphoetae TaxID=2049346 RepID=A0ABQ9XAB7_9EUKA|nr:putative DENN domain-containing protein 10 [Blattamonas nauphoetae]
METLSFVAILEKDKHDSCNVSWIYPAVPQGYERVLLNRSNLHGQITSPLIYSRFADLWHYTYLFEIGDESEDFPDQNMLRFTKIVSISIGSKQFYPERYFPLLKMFGQIYLDNRGNPTEILNCTLSLAFSGAITFKSKEISPPPFEEQKKSLLKTPLTDVTSLFGVSSIFFWHALITRRSVLVKSNSTPALLTLLRAFPLFVFHRQDWSILHPFITASELEIKDVISSTNQRPDAIQTHSTFPNGIVVGCTDPAVEALYPFDFVADMNEKTVVMRQASEDRDDDSELMAGPVFETTPFHKEAATIMKKSTNQKELVSKLNALTQKLVERVEGLREEIGKKNPFTPNAVKELLPDLPIATCRFLVDILHAEE